MIKKFAVLFIALLAMSAAMAFAGDDEAGSKKVHNMPPPQGEKKAHNLGAGAGMEKSMTGKLVCMGCTLKGDGARSDCAAFGHSHALMISDGRYISFLPNKFGNALMAGGDAHNKEITVTGSFFAKANMLDVKSFKIEDGPVNQWCHGHDGMDACASPK